MRRSVEIADTRGWKRTEFLMLMSILHFKASKEKENISLFFLYLELVPAREDRPWEAGKKKGVPGFLGGVPGFLGGVPGFFWVVRGFSGMFRVFRVFRNVP